MSNKVLPPWTPIQLDQSNEIVSVSLWGRRYEFCQSPFPCGIESASHALLASPIKLSAKVGGKDVTWEQGTIEITEQTPARVTLLQKAVSPCLELSASISIEYDGMLRVDWKLDALREVELEALTVEIPLQSEHASLFYYCPRRDREGPGTGGGTGGLIPADGFKASFCPYLWIGDEQRGLAWFSESPEKWSNDGADGAIEIVPSKDEVALRLRPINEPVSLSPDQGASTALAYTFGLQATPVKPVDKNAWDTRIFHVDQELGKFREMRLRMPDQLLDDMAHSGIRTICFHEHWTDIEGYFTTDYGEDLKELVEKCHQRGMQILLYFGFLISDLAPEWPTMGAECVVHPDDKGCYVPFDYPPQPIQNAYCVCYNSRWQDVTVQGVADVIAEYGIDGLYLDGTTTPWGCRNPAHGCGYRRSDGTLGYTYPFFAVRRMMKKLYELVMRNNPQGQINVHSSYYLTVPTLAWSTGYTDGEQFAWDEVEHESAKFDAGRSEVPTTFACIPLDRFRCEFMGHPLGLAADFLADTRGPFRFTESCAFTLLHDVPIRVWMRGDNQLEQQLWIVRDHFDVNEAQWLPYWNNSDYVKIQQPQAYCSLHCHPAGGILAVVSNLSREEQTIDADFNCDSLGISDNASGHDVVAGTDVTLTDSRLRCTLPSLGWKLLQIR